MKRTKKRVASILLSMAMVIALFAVMPMTALAAAPDPPSSTTRWDFTTVDADGSGTGWDWKQDTKTLTLTNFTHSSTADVVLYLPDGAIIDLVGANTITSTFNAGSPSYGITSIGSFSITGNGSLNVTSGNSTTSDSTGIYCTSLTISGSATVNTTGSTGSTDSYGVCLFYGGNVTITGTSRLTATGGTGNLISGVSAGIGTPGASNSINMTISGNAIVNAAGGSALNSSGLRLGSGSLNINGGTLTATGDLRSINPNYTVPKDYTYWVSTTMTDPGGTGTVSDGSFVIDNTFKFAKIEYGESPTLPTLTAGTVTRTSDTVATVQFSSNTAGLYAYQVDGTAPTAAALAGTATTAMVSGTNTINLTGLAAGEHTIYIAARSGDQVVTNLLTITIPAYSPAPGTPVSNVPQTGENATLWWTALLIGSLLFLAVITIMYFRKRHTNSNETR